MQKRQMEESFFGFDTSLGAGIDDRLDCLDDEDFGDYDAVNDETFGSEATAGDWEQDHEKLAQITESRRSRNNKSYDSKSDSDVDVESSLSHLVLDEKEVTIPKPGVWDSPNFALAPPQIQKPSLALLKNACTVEELERGLITNRPPPGLIKPPNVQPQPIQPHQNNSSSTNLFFNSIAPAEKLQQINGANNSLNQYPLGLQNLRLTHPQFQLQNVRPMPNQAANLLRYPLPPHLLIPPCAQRQPPLHGNFPLNNFPHPSNHAGPLPFMRPDHPMMPPYPNSHQPMQPNMHMGNQRNQNKQFNHNDHSDKHPHQPFFRNNQFFQNHNRFPFQGMHHLPLMHLHMNHMMNNGFGPPCEQDEYAGLMNNREKQWLNNIQLLQLNTNQPYIDDYYYTVFCDRQNRKNEIKKLNMINKKSNNGKNSNNNNNNNGHSRDRDSREKEQQTFTKGANTPMQFENSLGKLQYSSVTAPRKIIDMDVVPNSDPQQAASIQQKDAKKTRQLLLEIERLYMLLLKLEDKSNPLAIIAEQQREQQLREQAQQQQQEGGEPVPLPERRDILKEKEELTVQIMTPLLQLLQDDKFSSLLSIRKGRTLFLRFLSCIDVKEHELKLAKLWSAVIKGLAFIGRRESQFLINFYTEFHKWVDENCISFTMLMMLAKEFVKSSNQPTKNNSLTFALANKFGISVLSLMIKHAEDLLSYEPNPPPLFDEYWRLFLVSIGQYNISASSMVTPCETLDSKLLRIHLKRYENEELFDSFEQLFGKSNISG